MEKKPLPFACSFQDCGRRFATKANLDKHVADRHPSTQVEESKEKKILSKLLQKIDLLEQEAEKDSSNFREHLDIPALPNYDDIIGIEEDDDEDLPDDKYKKPLKTVPEEEEIDTTLKKDTNNQEENQQTTPQDKEEGVREITFEMINTSPNDATKKYENLEDIKEINLSNKKCLTFLNGRNIPFEELTSLEKLNISNNKISFSYDIRFFTNLIDVDISNNLIQDLSFCESIPGLKFLNAEHNVISSITSLNKCKKIKVLKLANNSIQYSNSTLKTIQNLKSIEELTIATNPFLEEIFGYRQLFIYKYPFILSLDGQKIQDCDRDVARQFTLENNPVNANLPMRPYSSVNRLENNEKLKKISEKEQEDLKEIENELNQTQTEFRVGSKIITKETYVSSKDKNTEQKKKKTTNPSTSKDVKILQKENQELKETVESQKMEIDTLKLEIENLTQINKDYEAMINNLKGEKTLTKDEENEKLKKELEVWKKEYYDLYDKMATNNYALKKSSENTKSTDTKTSKSQNKGPSDFDKLVTEIKIMKSRNALDDSLGHISGVEDKEENEEEREEQEVEDDSSDDIEEICRKSFQDLKQMRNEIKHFNERIDTQNLLNQQSARSVHSENPRPKVVIKQQGSTNANILANRPVIIKKGIKMVQNNLK